jgi:hypothetical protein
VWRLQAQDYAHLTDQDVIEDQDAVTIRTRNERTHTCAFPGVPATGRRGAWDNKFRPNCVTTRHFGVGRRGCEVRLARQALAGELD